MLYQLSYASPQEGFPSARLSPPKKSARKPQKQYGYTILRTVRHNYKG